MSADATVIGIGSISSGTSLASAAGNSTGFTKFLAIVTNFVNTAGDLNGNSFADNKGNTYVKVLWNGTGTGDAPMAGGDGVISYFLCEVGTGGTGHTATCTLPQAPFGATIKLIGISGALATSFDLATFNTGTIAVNTAMTVATGTLAQAVELVIATTIYDTDAGAGGLLVTGWSSGSMTLIGSDVTPSGGATPVTSAIGKQLSASTTSITASITPTGTGATTHQYVMAVATFKAAALTSPVTPPLVTGCAARAWQAAVDFIPNLLMTTLAVVAVQPPGHQLHTSAPVIKKDVSAFQPHNRLTLGIPAAPSLLPFGAQTVDQSAPSVRYQTSFDLYPNNLPLITLLAPAWNEFDPTPAMRKSVSVEQRVNVLPLQPAPVSLLPQGAQTPDAPAPWIKYQVQADVYQRPLTLGIPTAGAGPPLPLSSITLDDSAPVIKQTNIAEQYVNMALLGIPQAVSFLPFGAQTVDSSAPATKYQPQVDVYPYPLTLGLSLLPLGAQVVDSSAPATKYQPQVDVYPYPLTLGIPTPGAGPPLPLSSVTLDASAPATKYQPQVDVYPYPLTLGIPAQVFFLPLGAQSADASAPIQKREVVAEQYVNRLLLGYPLPPPAVQLPLSAVRIYDSAPPLKNPVYVDVFQNVTPGLPQVCVTLPAVTFYDFETPDTFMKDFGTHAFCNGDCAQVIMSQPGENIMGGAISSNQYEIEYVTSELDLFYGAQITIRGVVYRVLDNNMVDDGVFSRARLQT